MSPVLVFSLLLLGAGEAPVFDGYTAESSRAERDWEAKFRELPSAGNQLEYMRRLTARPHHVGSPFGREVAEWVLARFREWGFEARIETFDALFPTPKETRLEMLAPRRFTAALHEPAVSGDATSDGPGQLPPYNAYSADGDVTGPLVYVNYGMPDDYEDLARLGISVKGAVVIARYGHGWRGVKPKVAAEHGAAACIIYSDPADDGYAAGDIFPGGAFRPPDGVQRGSVMDTDYPGDPLTPGIASLPGAARLRLAEARTITRIPVLPVSYADAQPLLAELRGRVAPPRWRGGLPITYHVGPGPAKVRLKVASNWGRPPLYNVIARMTGSDFPDEWVLRGNHHDAWVHGADDPVAGLVAMLEEARAFGELRRQGWRPRRTLVFCAWDGEEPGLLGSTEWVEAHTPELLQHAVAYFNTDSNGRGFLMAEGSHVLEKFVNEVARDITDPEKELSIGDRRRALDLSRAHNAGERRELREHAGFRIGAMGDGSDYTAFIHHLGIPSVGLGFGGESNGGVYHSVYDDFYWYTHFGDPDFAYGRALSQTMGTAMMRIAGADLLPFDFAGLAETVKRYVSALRKSLETQREELTERNAQIKAGVFRAVDDPREPLLPPPAAEVPRHFNFAPLENAAEALATAAERYTKALASRPAKLDLAAWGRINRMLMASGPRLTDSSGLPHRPWFRNLVWAPGAYTGYESKPLPAIQEAMDRKDWKEAESQIPRTADAIEREAALVREIAAALETVVR